MIQDANHKRTRLLPVAMYHLDIHRVVQFGDDGLDLSSDDGLVGALDRPAVPVSPVDEVLVQCQPKRVRLVSSFQQGFAATVRRGRLIRSLHPSEKAQVSETA